MDTTTIFTHEAPQSNSVIVTRLKAVSDLNRLKDVMHAEHIEWDTKVTNSGSRFFDPKRKLATAMSEVYKALEELASAEETPWDYDQKYRDLTKAQSALTSAKANSQLGPEDENQLAIDEGNVVFTVFAHIATRSGYLNSMVDFGPCRTKSKAYFKGFVSWLLQVSCPRLQPCKANHL
jgi:hypothetical protein